MPESYTCYSCLVVDTHLPPFYWILLFDNEYLIYFTFCLFHKYVLNIFIAIWLTLPMNEMIILFAKFAYTVSFLIFIRTGTPRYRYDYLTKLGWIKYLAFNLTIFLLSYMFLFYY